MWITQIGVACSKGGFQYQPSLPWPELDLGMTQKQPAVPGS